LSIQQTFAVALKVFDRYVGKEEEGRKIAVVYLPITCQKTGAKRQV
jgi:hypothetical protein